MATEREPLSSIVPVGELPFTRHVEGRGDFTPVGVIFFDKGEKMILLAEEFGGNLHAKFTESQGLRRDGLLETGRGLDLSHCSEVTVMQFKHGSEIRVGLSETIERHAPTSIRFSYSPISTELDNLGEKIQADRIQSEKETEKRVFHAPERAVLEAMAGERGGIAVFKDGDSPVANAFVIERKLGEQVSGYVLLFAASEMHGGYEIKSTEALENFLQRINLAFEQQSRLPIQTAALKAYDEQQISFTQSAREAAYRGQVIANARLLTHTRHTRYKRFLEEHVQDVRTHLIARLTAALKKKISQEERERSVDRIILGDESKREELLIKQEEILAPQPKALPSETKPRIPDICERLKSEWAKEVRIGYDPQFGIHNAATKGYLQAIYGRVRSGQSSLQDLDDMARLLSELLGSRFSDSDLGQIPAEYTLEDFPGIIVPTRGDRGAFVGTSYFSTYSYVKGGTLIGRIMNAIEEERKRLRDEN